MSSCVTSIFQSVLNTGLKLAEIILTRIIKPIINKFFDLKEIKEISNDPILDKDEKQVKLEMLFMTQKIILNHINLIVLLIIIMLNIGVMVMKIKIYQLKNILMKLDLI